MQHEPAALRSAERSHPVGATRRGNTADLFGAHEIAVRLPSVLLGAGTSGLMFLAGRNFWGGDRWGLAAVVAINATVTNTLTVIFRR